MNIHPQLENDCIIIGRFELCQLLLMNDANYPWFILVPDRDNITELYQLSAKDQQRFIRESSSFSATLAQVFKPDKLNIAALGNVVPQLHVHHVVRYETDPAWPAPVWGAVPAIGYEDAQIKAIISKLRDALGQDFTFMM